MAVFKSAEHTYYIVCKIATLLTSFHVKRHAACKMTFLSSEVGRSGSRAAALAGSKASSLGRVQGGALRLIT